MDSKAWDARYAEQGLLWSAEPNRFLVDEVADLPPGRALDLACGEGRNAIWLATLGWEVTGVDFSPVALDKAKRGATEQRVTVEWVLADAVHFRASPHSYDLVVVMYLQLPAEERRAAFGAAAEALAPGGTLLIVGHDSSNLAQGWGGPRDPAVLYGPGDVVGTIAPLAIVKARQVHRPVDTEAGERTAIDVLVRATRMP
jgi:2-polyprenyl-3-methyl-5-hydroxy-6-metoxy-1,4-benzoquinol methylase